MSGYEMETKIRGAFAAETPDVWEKILQNAEKGRGRKLDPDLGAKTKAVARFYFRRTALLAAAVVLAFAAVMGAAIWSNARVFSTITFDTDLSLTLRLNKDNKALSVRPNGHGAAAVAGMLDLEGESVDEAVADVIGALLETGSLNETENTVLLAAASEERIRGGELLDAAVTAAQETFEEKRFDGAILRAEGGAVDEKTKLTAGKRAAVNAIASADVSQNQQELMKLSATELALLLRDAGANSASVILIGAVSEKGLISAEEALWVALDTLDKTASDRFDARLTALDGALVYRLRLVFGDLSYRYLLSAADGEILEVIRSDKSTDIVLVRKTPSQPRLSSGASSNSGVNNVQSAPVNAAERTAEQVGEAEDRADVPNESPTIGEERKETAAPLPLKDERIADEPDPAAPTGAAIPVTTEEPRTENATDMPTEPALPAIFIAKDFLPGSFSIDYQGIDGVDEIPLAFSVVGSGTNLYFDQTNYPYAEAYTPDAQTALVCSRDQFESLLHTDDADFDDAFFEENALVVLLVQHTRKTYAAEVTVLYRVGEKLTPVISGGGSGIPGIADEAVSVYSLMISVKKSDIAAVTALTVPGYANGYELAVLTAES